MRDEGRATRDVRRTGRGESVPGPVLRDFLLGCIRHDALADAALERLDGLAKEGRDDHGTTAKMVRDLVGDLLAVAMLQDWIYVGAALKDAYEDATAEEGAPGGAIAHGPAAPPGDGGRRT